MSLSTKNIKKNLIQEITPAQNRAARELLRLTQSDLSKLIKLDTTTIGYFEQGRTKPSKKNMKKLRSFFEGRGIIFINTKSKIGVAMIKNFKPEEQNQI